MDTPSWVRSVPKNFGAKQAGTLKADEWRTMCTLYLPVALILLWNRTWNPDVAVQRSPHRKEQLALALDHTMYLVGAIRAVSTQTTDALRAMKYHKLMSLYVQNLTKVHETTTYVSNHHAAMHIREFLLMFGPVYSWWCFPFERLIGTLQNSKTDNMIGISIIFLVAATDRI